MTAPDGLLEDVASAILDGTPIDWAEIESRSDQTDRSLLEQLKLLATLRTIARSSESPDGSKPEFWGHLRVFECIGRGAYGEVYRSWDPRLDREVALKLLPIDSAAGDARKSAIIEEGRLLARVRHPNVVTLYGAERIGEQIGLWMELVKGRTLEDVLGEGRTFTTKEVIDLGVQLCKAVSAVHRAGLIHRDVKAQNVMLADDGRVVLMDFGTGRELTEDSETSAAGTPLYLAPEVLAGETATVLSDIYSMGVLFYRLLTRSYPVRANGLADLRRAHTNGERTDVQSARPDLPSKLARVIERAIDPEPRRRYQSADALAADLATIDARHPLVRMAYATGVALALVVVMWGGWQLLGRPEIGRRSSGGSRAALAASVSSGRPVIAVLPFKNLSAAPDSGYFVDGLTGEIIRNLAVIEGMDVRSQTSSFFFKDKPRNLREVGDQLRTNLVVEGSVLRAGNRLRINAQLVRVSDDVPLWSERFDRGLEDVFSIQDEISRAIVNRLRLTLGRGQRRYNTNLEAYELYLRAHALIDRRGNENAQHAAALFEQVIAKDSAFAPAYAGLTHAYAYMSMEIPGLPYEEALARMRPAAAKALELDPLLAEAHAAMGMTYARERQWENARQSFRRAIELNPSLTQIRTNYSSSTLLPLGRLDEAERLLDAALQIDPLSLAVRRELANLQIISGRYDEAIANLKRVRAVDPDFTFADLFLARALTFSGRLAEAWPVWETRKEQPGWQFWMANAYVMSGQRSEVERMIAVHEHPYRLAVLYAALGDNDRAFEALNRATDLLPHRVALLLVYPEMAPLRGDPRFNELRKKLNLP
jgi:TolB-like protein/thioredoxin-like negative regulator of GroEL